MLFYDPQLKFQLSASSFDRTISDAAKKLFHFSYNDKGSQGTVFLKEMGITISSLINSRGTNSSYSFKEIEGRFFR